MAKYKYIDVKPMVLYYENRMIPLLKNTVIDLPDDAVKTKRLRRVLMRMDEE